MSRHKVNNSVFVYPGKDAPPISVEQMAYAFHKFIWGARPDTHDDSWNALDQAAYDAAASQCVHYEIRDNALYVLPYDVMKEASE